MKISFVCPMDYLGDGLPQGWPVPGYHWDAQTGIASYGSNLALAELADTLGFDWVSLTEHHYSPRLMTPNPMLMAAAFSQRVKRAKIALLGPILPQLNPVRTAEECAMLDVLTEGRLVVGFLRGFAIEFQTYGVNPAETRALFEEGLELILRAWTETRPFSWEGRRFRFRTVSIWPRPVQQPHPPIYMSGKAPESAIFAARNRISMSLSFNTLEECLDAVPFYREQASKEGWEPTTENVLYRHFCYVANTDEQAQQVAAEYGFGVRNSHTVAGPRAAAAVGARITEGQSLERVMTATLDRPVMWEGSAFIGSPDTVAHQLAFAHEVAGIGIFDLIFTGLPHNLTVASMKLFAEEVLPRVRDQRRAYGA